MCAVAPLTNVGVMINKDPGDFSRKTEAGCADGWDRSRWDMAARIQLEVEWNILNDIAAVQALFGAGVPLGC